jgi:drug/metabolite transporter, DME family
LTDRSDERLGIAAAVGAAIVYGAAYPATAVALRSFSPIAVAGLANTIAIVIVLALVVVGVLPMTSPLPLSPARLARLVALASLGGIFFIAATNIAVAISGPTITGFVAPLYAVFATVFAVPLLGERVRPSVLLAFGLALVGTALLAGTTPAGVPLVGALVAFAAAALFGLYIVLARRWGGPYELDGTLVTIASLVGRGPILLAVALITDPATTLPAGPELAAIGAVLFIAVGSSSSGNLLLLASVRRVAAARTAGALLLTPLASAILAAVFLGDHLTPGGLVGAALILGSMAVAPGLVRPVLSRREEVAEGPTTPSPG